MRIVLILVLSFVLGACSDKSTPNKNSLASQTQGFEHREGFIDLYVSDTKGKVYANLPKAENKGVSLRLIYTARLTAGLGSNPIGLDRGWGDSGQLISFREVGGKVVIEVENLMYRASANEALEKKAVNESFARSFIGSMDVLARGSNGEMLVDLTEFLKRDALSIIPNLAAADQGSFSLVKDRTVIQTNAVLSFPDNVEMDVFLTLSSAKPGSEVSSTAANGRDVTLIQHHSFVRLPDNNYTPRRSDPRAGAVEEVHFDYSAALTDTIERRLARRFRLEKINPDAAQSKVKKPIIFYIDGGAPEPVRSALIEGASWWKEAFEAAGYSDAYQVKVLPDDIHPLDVRYNVVQWVHRQTRGWSYGGGVSDPRTGEMLKGHVNLGSLRVRQDRMIFEGLSGTAKLNSGDSDDPVELALARIRQLSAHEVGHALGFAHNFAASTYDKQSVMDYPAPDVRAVNGALDFSYTYGVGIGEWDKFTTRWLYADNTKAQRETLIANARAKGLAYVADRDARSLGTAHPRGSLWDNGADPVSALNQVTEVRAIALRNFDRSRIQDWQPLSDLNKTIVPIYLFHRYQVAAAGKVIGGISFDYSLAGDNNPGMRLTPPQEQRRAAAAIIGTLDPGFLDLSNHTLALLTPSLGSFSIADSQREMFGSLSYPSFDLISAADVSANMKFDVLLNPTRLARMDEHKRRDANQLSPQDLFKMINSYVMKSPNRNRQVSIAETVRTRYASRLMDIIGSDASASVKAQAQKALMNLSRSLGSQNTEKSRWLSQEIERFSKRPVKTMPATLKAQKAPPGGPIGSGRSGSKSGELIGSYETCWHCE